MARRPPSLNAIAAFEAAARHGSFARAAQDLNLTTSAISHAIRGLEHRLGTRLFDRAGRGVALTGAGQTLAVRVRLSLALLDDAFDMAGPPSREVLRVSTLASIAARLAPALADFPERFPAVNLVLECSSLLADLGGAADVAIRFGPGGWAGCQAQHLANERLFPVAAPGTPCATLDDLRQLPRIGQPENTWRLWFETLGRSPDDFPSVIQIDDHRTALEAAAAGAGVALARAWVVEPWLAGGHLERLLDHAVDAEYSYWAVWDNGSPKRRLIEDFVAWLAPWFAPAVPVN